MNLDFIDNLFMYHPPTGNQAESYEALREAARKFAYLLNDLVPEDRYEKSIAIDRLRETVMWANAGIACAPPPSAAKCPCGSREAWAWAGKAGQEPGPHHSEQCGKWRPPAAHHFSAGILSCSKTETSNDTGQDEPVVPPAPQG